MEAKEKIGSNQCRFCLKFGHWARDCRKRKLGRKDGSGFKKVNEILHKGETDEDNEEKDCEDVGRINKNFSIYSANLTKDRYNLPRIPVRITGKVHLALIDTGAEVSLIMKEQWEKLR